MTSTQPVPKDCRTCRVRRIRCDRTTPCCTKCTNRGLACPGFGPRFRWTNAIASRGRFKGLGAPRVQDGEEVVPSQPEKPQCGPTPKSELLDEGVSDQLMHYYTAEIAPLNVWIDSHHNGYRRHVIPLAKTQRHLQLAIISIAAAVCAPCRLKAGLELSQAAYRKAVWLVTEQLRKLTGMKLGDLHGYIDANVGTAEAVLAATLVLSNSSLFKCDFSSAFLHLQGARVLIQTLTTHRTSGDGLFIFLRNQVAALDILICTTLFNADYIQGAALSELSHGHVMLGHFLDILHSITLQSTRQRSDESEDINFPILKLEDEFQLAQGESLMAAGRLTELSSDSYRRDVTRLVQAYHHAGLLYACRRLHYSNVDEVAKTHCTGLFRVLANFENVSAWVGNLVWPIFMGGISCSGNPEQMATIRDLYQMLLAKSPFKYYANIPTFLEELWSSSHGDWTLMARAWEDQGFPVLAI